MSIGILYILISQFFSYPAAPKTTRLSRTEALDFIASFKPAESGHLQYSIAYKEFFKSDTFRTTANLTYNHQYGSDSSSYILKTEGNNIVYSYPEFIEHDLVKNAVTQNKVTFQQTWQRHFSSMFAWYLTEGGKTKKQINNGDPEWMDYLVSDSSTSQGQFRKLIIHNHRPGTDTALYQWERFEYTFNVSLNRLVHYKHIAHFFHKEQYLEHSLISASFNDFKEDSVFQTLDRYTSTKEQFKTWKDLTKEVYHETKLLALNTPFPIELTVPLPTGRSSSRKSKYTLAVFSYSRCYPCMILGRSLDSLRKQYSNKQLQIVVLDPFDNPTQLKEYQSKHPDLEIQSITRAQAEGCNVTGYPTVYLLDKDKRIILSYKSYHYTLPHRIRELLR